MRYQSSPVRTRNLLAAAALLSLLPALAACKPEPKAADPGDTSAATSVAGFQQSRDNVAKAAKQLAANARPITDAGLLATHLRIVPARAKLLAGNGGGETGSTTSVAAMNYSCGGGQCTCYGDDDCNSMFSGICRSPSTGGRCEDWGDGMTVCTCNVLTPDDDTPTPTEPG